MIFDSSSDWRELKGLNGKYIRRGKKLPSLPTSPLQTAHASSLSPPPSYKHLIIKSRIIQQYSNSFSSLGHKISLATWQWPWSPSLIKLLPLFLPLSRHDCFARTLVDMKSQSLRNGAKGSSDRSMCNTWLTVEQHLVYLAQNWFQQRFPLVCSQPLRCWSKW